MCVIERAIAKGQALQDIARDEGVIFWTRSPLVSDFLARNGDVRTHNIRVGEESRHLIGPAARATSYIQNAPGILDWRREVAAQCVAQHVVLEVEAVDLFVIGRQDIRRFRQTLPVIEMSPIGASSALRRSTTPFSPPESQPAHADSSLRRYTRTQMYAQPGARTLRHQA